MNNRPNYLVNSKEIAQVIGLRKLGVVGTFVGWILMKILQLSELNKIYKKHCEKEGKEFLDAVIEDFNIKFEIPDEDLARLPKQGPFITISNHPLGGVDGILLLKLLLKERSDYKIIANFLLQRIAPLSDFVLPVNPFENRKEVKSSILGFKNAMKHLQSGNPLGVFPAGEVSTYKDGKLVVDKPWEEAAIKLIKKAEVPVIPIYFHAKNSKFFYILSRISATMRTAKLPSELISNDKKVIKVRIGKPISVKDQKNFEDIKSYSEFLRRKTYMLSNYFETKKKILPNLPTTLKPKKTPEQIVGAVNKDFIIRDINLVRKKDFRLLVHNHYEVFLAPASEIPHILREVGRLREITFREIGEGTNLSLDVDKYDSYYHHMFLWDNKEEVIVGAYRMGLGNRIYNSLGIEGFYLQELFRMEPELHSMMSKSIEMGRAFIIKSYQQKPMPLFLLWKGIVHTTIKFPEHKYLIGGVSISNQFSNFSKSLMIEFMKSHYYDPYIAQYVSPKKEFKVKLKDADKEFVFDSAKSDLNKFDKIIDELEPGTLRLPVLLKKYIKQNAKLVAFNVDPLFNNAVDGLMYIKIADLPESTVKPVLEEIQAEIENKLSENEKFLDRNT